ncbi:MAG TPA: MerR family transcriptional regulator [Ktedonobacterales bacterium]|nr:MerR family transcriptional regulator [Ktedonobacterales bacterium]
MLRANAMTIGQLSQRTGVPIKVLRGYERRGFLYTLGRSEGNYRLFGDEALWCVRVIQSMRSLGLTLNEIQQIVTQYLEQPDEPTDTLLNAHLARALARVEARIAALQAIRGRILDVQVARAGPGTRTPSAELTRRFGPDPRRSAPTATSTS